MHGFWHTLSNKCVVDFDILVSCNNVISSKCLRLVQKTMSCQMMYCTLELDIKAWKHNQYKFDNAIVGYSIGSTLSKDHGLL